MHVWVTLRLKNWTETIRNSNRFHPLKQFHSRSNSQCPTVVTFSDSKKHASRSTGWSFAEKTTCYCYTGQGRIQHTPNIDESEHTEIDSGWRAKPVDCKSNRFWDSKEKKWKTSKDWCSFWSSNRKKMHGKSFSFFQNDAKLAWRSWQQNQWPNCPSTSATSGIPYARRPARKPFVNYFQRRRRVIFAKKYSEKPLEYWERTIFSDESSFDLFWK